MATESQLPAGFVPGLSEDGHMVAGPSKLAADASGADATIYLREIRNWMRFLGIVVLVGVVAAIIIGVVVAHEGSSATLGGITSNSNCLSQGGTDPSC